MEGIGEGAAGGRGCSSVGVQPRVRLKLCVKKQRWLKRVWAAFCWFYFICFFLFVFAWKKTFKPKYTKGTRWFGLVVGRLRVELLLRSVKWNREAFFFFFAPRERKDSKLPTETVCPSAAGRDRVLSFFFDVLFLFVCFFAPWFFSLSLSQVSRYWNANDAGDMEWNPGEWEMLCMYARPCRFVIAPCAT